MKYLLALTIMFATATAFAAVPNTFTAGTPARAAEVNDNFTNLDGRINTLETATSPDICLSLDGRKISSDLTTPVVYSNQSLGVSVVAGSDTYKMYKVPFIDLSTGDEYSIKLPVMNNSVWVYYERRTIPNTCDTATISGKSSVVSFRTTASTSAFLGTQTSVASRMSRSTVMEVWIDVGVDTVLQLIYQSPQETQSSTLVQGDFNLSDDFTVLLGDEPATTRTSLASLLQYIEIVKVP